MYTDAEQEFSNSQSLTVTAVSTSVVNTGSDRNLGIGEPMGVVFNVVVGAGGTAPTFLFQLQTGSTATPTTIIASQGYGGTNEPNDTLLVAGYQFVLPIPPNATVDQYLRVNYTLGGTSPTLTVDASIRPLSMIQNDVVYPKNYNIQ